jgi:hypothetical protein
VLGSSRRSCLQEELSELAIYDRTADKDSRSSAAGESGVQAHYADTGTRSFAIFATMTSLYTPSDGINQRRGKSKSPTQASFFPNSGDTDDSKVGWESTALRIKYRERSAVFILAIVLSLVGFRYFLGATRDMTGDKSSLRSVEGYRWKNYPRVVFLAGERDRNPVQGNSQLPPLSWYAEPLAKARFFKHLQDSSSYDEGKSDAFETKTCKPQYPWQTRSFPSCNLLHEESMASHVARSSNELRRVGNGYWRDVWALPSSRFEKKLVLKTIRYEHQYLERNYDRHRRDALAMERLTQNPFVVDIYAYCGNSGVFEFADGGDIAEALWPHDPVTRRRTYGVTSRLQRLHIGKQNMFPRMNDGHDVFTHDSALLLQEHKQPWDWLLFTM